MFGGVSNRIQVNVTPFTSLTETERFHLDLMPSVCLLHKCLLHFISGFVNYKARKLLGETSIGHFKKPSGDVVIANFSKLLDCPDILIPLSKCWNEDVEPHLTGANGRSISHLMNKMEDYVTRMYPVLYS